MGIVGECGQPLVWVLTVLPSLLAPLTNGNCQCCPARLYGGRALLQHPATLPRSLLMMDCLPSSSMLISIPSQVRLYLLSLSSFKINTFFSISVYATNPDFGF